MLRAGNEADALVAEVEQVLGRDLAGGPFVDADRGDVELVECAVHEYELRSLAQQPLVVAVVAAQVRHLA